MRISEEIDLDIEDERMKAFKKLDEQLAYKEQSWSHSNPTEFEVFRDTSRCQWNS